MNDYVPMTGPLPGVRYMPSSSDAGYVFISEWCANCERDKESNGTVDAEHRDVTEEDWCPILGASFRNEAVEWRDLGEHNVCLGFVKMGATPPTPRCEHTLELPF